VGKIESRGTQNINTEQSRVTRRRQGEHKRRVEQQQKHPGTASVKEYGDKEGENKVGGERQNGTRNTNCH